jgi:hypothetical protein
MKWYSSYSTAIHFSWHSFRFEEIIWTTKNINHSTDAKFLNNLYSLLYTMIRRSTSTPSPVWMLHIGWTLFDRHDYYFTSIIGWTLFDSHDWRWTPGFHRQLYFPCRNPRVQHVILPDKINFFSRSCNETFMAKDSKKSWTTLSPFKVTPLPMKNPVFFLFFTMYTNGFFHLKFRYLHGTIIKIVLLFLAALLEANFYTMTPSSKWSSMEVEEPNYHKKEQPRIFWKTFHSTDEQTEQFEKTIDENKFRLTCSIQ